jgi:ABC-type multidrug transport system fused ATPase/permease subunit
MASRLHEVFASLPMVQAFGRERHEHQRFETQNEADLAESVQAARLDALSARSVELIGAVATAVVVGAGALEVLAGRLSVGALLVFTSYLHGLYRPMRTLAKLSARFAKARVSAGRIADILGTAPELDDRPDAIGAYEPGRPVLQDVSFHVRPGQRVAVVGPSGAGKSTLVSLLLRLYAPTGGRILVDGVDIAAYRRESLRQAMAVVLQHTVLFGASIRENIAYGKLDATDADVREAARRAGADDFIQALPRGYDTVVGERGATLSGGQRQRLSIARAMIRPASILLLDEPMTGLDHRTETAVHDALARAAAGRTALLVTHDLATAASADLVLVLDGGRLVDAGTHEALIGRCALYRHLHRGAGARDGEAVPA